MFAHAFTVLVHCCHSKLILLKNVFHTVYELEVTELREKVNQWAQFVFLKWSSQLKCQFTQYILLTYQFSLCVKPNSTKAPFLLLTLFSCFVILPDSPGVKGARPWKNIQFCKLVMKESIDWPLHAQWQMG